MSLSRTILLFALALLAGSEAKSARLPSSAVKGGVVKGSARSAVNGQERTTMAEMVYTERLLTKKVKPTAWKDSLASHFDPANSFAWSVIGGPGSL